MSLGLNVSLTVVIEAGNVMETRKLGLDRRKGLIDLKPEPRAPHANVGTSLRNLGALLVFLI